MRREKKIIRIEMIVAMLIAIIGCLAYGVNAYAASDVKVTISGGTVEQGKDITVTATISSEAEIFGFDAYIVYDMANLEYKSGSIASDAGDVSGGNGRIRIYSDVCQSKSISVTLVFTAKQPGEHSIAFASAAECVFYDTEINSLNMVSTPGTVKVNAPALYSSDNTLSIIYAYSVFENGSTKPAWYWPDFSSSRTSYDLVVEGDVTKLNITATANHKKATVAVSDTTLNVGKNKVTITVTAEDGSKKEYVINVTKNEKVTEPPTTQPPTTTPSATTQPEETTTVAPKEDIKVTIGSKEYIVMNYTDEMALPEGYELYTTTYKGEEVVALKGLGTEIVLMGLSEDGKTIINFIFNEKTEQFSKLNFVNTNSAQYVILEMISDLGDIQMPNGYTLKSVTVNGNVVDAYASDDNSLYVVYAMNWNGENALYYFDAVNNTMMKYFTVTNGDIGYVEEDESSTKEPTTQVGGNVTDKNTNIDSDEVKELKDRQQIIIIVALVIILILLGIIIAMAVSKNNKDDEEEFEDEDEYDDEDYEDEEEFDDEELEDEDEYDDEDYEDEEEENDSETDRVDAIDITGSAVVATAVASDDTTDAEDDIHEDIAEDVAIDVAADVAKYMSEDAASNLEEDMNDDISSDDVSNDMEEDIDEAAADDSSLSMGVVAEPDMISSDIEDEEEVSNVNKLLEDDSKSLESDELDMVLDDILDSLS